MGSKNTGNGGMTPEERREHERKLNEQDRQWRKEMARMREIGRLARGEDEAARRREAERRRDGR
jgi:hypothetical protein